MFRSKLRTILRLGIGVGAVLGLGAAGLSAKPREATASAACTDSGCRAVTLARPGSSLPEEASESPAGPRRPSVVAANTPRSGVDRTGAPPDNSSKAAVPLPFWLSSEDRRVEALVYPPQDRNAPRPLTVMLHGMCDEPQAECPQFAQAVTKKAWLVCPRADARCRGGGYVWQHTRREQTVEAAVELVKSEFGAQVSEAEGRTLIGFSLGAIFGMDLAHKAAGKYPRVLLIGAKITPQPGLLEAAGVERLILAAGDFDMMHDHMKDQARRVRNLPTQFVSLGPSGHWFPGDFGPRLESMLSWLDAEPAQ